MGFPNPEKVLRECLQFRFLAENACFEIVFCPRIHALVFALRVGTGMEKAGIFYQSAASFFAFDSTIRYHDTFTHIFVSVCMAFLFDAAAYLYLHLGKLGVVKTDMRAGARRRCQ